MQICPITLWNPVFLRGFSTTEGTEDTEVIPATAGRTLNAQVSTLNSHLPSICVHLEDVLP
jgi:hypothetical protein